MGKDINMKCIEMHIKKLWMELNGSFQQPSTELWFNQLRAPVYPSVPAKSVTPQRLLQLQSILQRERDPKGGGPDLQDNLGDHLKSFVFFA